MRNFVNMQFGVLDRDGLSFKFAYYKNISRVGSIYNLGAFSLPLFLPLLTSYLFLTLPIPSLFLVFPPLPFSHFILLSSLPPFPLSLFPLLSLSFEDRLFALSLLVYFGHFQCVAFQYPALFTCFGSLSVFFFFPLLLPPSPPTTAQ